MLRTRSAAHIERRGAILLVVVVLLAMFATIALAWVLFSSSSADSSRIFREALTQEVDDSPPTPELLYNRALAQLIYDVPDEGSELFNAVRGWSLARDKYGWNPGADNTVPFNGLGILRYPIPGVGLDNSQMVSFVYHPSDGFIRDPERYGTRTPGSPPNPQFVGKNAPYTYPDTNHLFLSAISGRGHVLVPSFHRPWIFGSLDPSNPNWTNPMGKYLTLRPRPAEHPNFPMPLPNADGTFGDVINFGGVTGTQHDSIWIDHAMPVRKWRGKEYVPLFAWMVVDMDGRVNMNVAGNLKNGGAGHASNQGWGQWGINPASAPSAVGGPVLANDPTEFFTIMTSAGGPIPIGRYGRDGIVTKFNMAPMMNPGVSPPWYAQVDMDGDAAQPIMLPTTELSGFPTFPPAYGNGNDAERTLHPAMFNPYFLNDFDPPPAAGGMDRVFPVSDIRNLMLTLNPGTERYQLSELAQIAPNNFAQDVTTPGTLSPRMLTTTLSNDVAVGAASPWISMPGSYNVMPPNPSDPTMPTHRPVFNTTQVPPAPPGTTGEDFGPDGGRNRRLQQLPAIDLNRQLTDYRDDESQPFGVGNVNPGSPKFTQATEERVMFAREIYQRLTAATGADAADPSPTTRYLAQLAVNIVDYIDNDDIMTGFDPGNGIGMVWGVELPRLVLNEVYCQMNNDPMEASPNMPEENPPDSGTRPATLPYQVNFWVELHNTLRQEMVPTTTLLSDQGAARLVGLQGGNPYPIYKVLITNEEIRPQGNAGDPTDPTGVRLEVRDYTPEPDPAPPPVLMGDELNLVRPMPNPNQYMSPPASNQGFYVLGPAQDFPVVDPDNPPAWYPESSLRVQSQPAAGGVPANGLMYTVELDPAPDFENLPRHNVMLRRLANPYLPESPSNPFITVDHVEGVQVQDGVEYSQTGDRRAPAGGAEDPPMNVMTPIPERVSFGARAPYVKHNTPTSQQFLPQEPMPPPTEMPKHTLFRHNGQGDMVPGEPGDQTLRMPFDWLVHLDRQLVSPAELFHVSACAPHELTHLFLRPPLNPGEPPVPHGHTAPWAPQSINLGGGGEVEIWTSQEAQDARLYRALEWLRTGSRMTGVGLNAREPGKINLNTVWDFETFKALCDAQPGNRFTDQEVFQMWNWLSLNRTPGLANPTPQLSENDRPIMPFSNPYYGTGGMGVPVGTPDLPDHFVADSNSDGMSDMDGLQGTLLRAADPFGMGGGPVLDPVSKLPFNPAGGQPDHPYMRYELLRKMMNSMTTRSNVFAVWCTVGYFEVEGYNPAGRPILGEELTTAGGETLRHKFFAVVDRTNLSIDPNTGQQGNKPIYFVSRNPAEGEGQPVWVTVPATNGTDSPPGSGQFISLDGINEGEQWSLKLNVANVQAGSLLWVGEGMNLEAVTIEGIQIQPGPPTEAQILIRPANPHAAGFRIMTAQPGNPGPQPNFNYNFEPYSSVVRFVERLE